MAYVYDPEGVAEDFMNLESILTCAVGHPHWEMQLKGLIAAASGGNRQPRSPNASWPNWDGERLNFLQVCPKEMVARLPYPLSDEVAKVPAE